MYLFAPAACRTGHTHCRTDGVNVGMMMSHNKYLGGITHQLSQCICHDTGLNLGTLFHFLGYTAKEFKGIPVFDDGLVTAPGQRHIQCHQGKFIFFFQCLAIPADTDGQGGIDALTGDNGTHGIQYREFILGNLCQIPFLHDENILVTVIFAQYAVDILCPFANTVVNRCQQRCLLRVADIFDQLLIIVDGYNGNHRTAFFMLFAQGNQLCGINPVQCHQHTGAAV